MYNKYKCTTNTKYTEIQHYITLATGSVVNKLQINK